MRVSTGQALPAELTENYPFFSSGTAWLCQDFPSGCVRGRSTPASAQCRAHPEGRPQGQPGLGRTTAPPSREAPSDEHPVQSALAPTLHSWTHYYYNVFTSPSCSLVLLCGKASSFTCNSGWKTKAGKPEIPLPATVSLHRLRPLTSDGTQSPLRPKNRLGLLIPQEILLGPLPYCLRPPC